MLHMQGEALYCFVTMNDGASFGDSTQKELITLIRTKIAPFAMPDYIQVRRTVRQVSVVA